MKAKRCWKRGVGYASFRMLAIMALGLFSCAGCNSVMQVETEEDCMSVIQLAISETSFSVMKELAYDTRSVWSKGMDDIDTNDFILSVTTEQGAKVYEGKYGSRPEQMRVVPGTYNIKLRSGEFKKPQFEMPVYGDDRAVAIEKDSTARVTLMCRQTNSAIRLRFTDKFKEQFPGKGLILEDSNGRMLYPYDSQDYCYVLPGPVGLMYNNGISDTLLFSKQLPAQQMLTLNLSYAPGSKSALLKIEKDTVRIWKSENFNVGLKIPTGAVTIDQAKEMIGEKSVMVFGFVLGGDVTENTIRVRRPFSSRTHLLIAPLMSERNRYNMFAVELPSGDIREALNLVDNRDILGSAIVVTGNIVESYFGYPGIKSTKACTVLY